MSTSHPDAATATRRARTGPTTSTSPSSSPSASASWSGSSRRTSRCSSSRSATAFVALIKMMIQPVIFCTIVLGVGSVASAARVGKVGGLALAYFLAMSTVALAIGLVVGNILHPGLGPAPDRRTSPPPAPRRPTGRTARTTDFLLGIIPTSLFSSLTSGEVLQTLLVALLVGFALQAMGTRRQADPARRRLPAAAGVPGPGDDHVGGPGRRLRRDGGGRRRDRRGRAEEPRGADVRLLRHLRAVRLRRARHACCKLVTGVNVSRCSVPRPASSC